MLIVEENFVEGGTVTASSEAAAMPASNLKILQPSVRHRMTTITGDTWIEASLREGDQFILGYDVVALIGYDGAPSRNILRSALNFDTGDWTLTDVVTPLEYTLTPPTGWNTVVAYFQSSSSTMKIAQTVTRQGSLQTLLPLKIGVIARNDVPIGGDLDLIIRVYSTISTHEVNVTFDLSAGTAGTPNEIGDFTDGGATITALGDGFYLCELVFTPDVAATLTSSFESSAASVGEFFWLSSSLLMLQSEYPTAPPVEYPFTSHDGSGPMWDIRRGLFTSPTAGPNTGWVHMATRNQLKEFPRFSAFIKLDSIENDPFVRLNIWDRDNTLGYIESGHLIIGKSVNLGSKLRTITLEAEESGGQQEAHGGQIYRPQRKVRRRLRLEMVAFTKAQAMDNIYFLNRVKGRSRQILVIAQPDDPVYAQEQMIYGYIDSLDPIPSKASHSGDHWTWGMTMIETP